MHYRLLTVNREFGSGGGRIAQTIAKSLGWKLLDKDIIDAIAYQAHVDVKDVHRYDEHCESWLRRINQQTMRSAALAAGLDLNGNEVLQHKPDTFHVFVYAPHRERILRLRQRLPEGVDVEARIRTIDGERAQYLQQYWGKYWLNPHLYDLMISSENDEDETARIIQTAMTGALEESFISK